jgi:hypothetical protein
MNEDNSTKYFSYNNFLIGILGGGGVESNWVHTALRPLIGLLC